MASRLQRLRWKRVRCGSCQMGRTITVPDRMRKLARRKRFSKTMHCRICKGRRVHTDAA